MSSLHLKPTNACIILRIKSTSLTVACKALCGLLHCSFPGLISYHSFPFSLCSSHAYCLDFLPKVWAHFYIIGLSVSTTYSWKTLLPDLHSFTSFKFLCKHLFREGTAWQPSLIDRPLCYSHSPSCPCYLKLPCPPICLVVGVSLWSPQL